VPLNLIMLKLLQVLKIGSRQKLKFYKISKMRKDSAEFSHKIDADLAEPN
jgi:hypothetical protein